MTIHSPGPATAEEPFDLYIIGLGTVGVVQLTREAEQALARCKEVLYLDPGLGVRTHLEHLVPVVTDLSDCYRLDDDRMNAYDRMTELTLDASLSHAPVAFAVYGHPRFFVYPTEQLLQTATALGLRSTVLPGISTLDAMIIDLGLDPGYQGLQIYEATDALLRRRPLQNDVPTLLLQVGALETALTSTRRSAPGRYERLYDYLRTFYPDEHVVAFISTRTYRLARSQILPTQLADIRKNVSQVTPEMTLYIPPAHIRGVAPESEELLKGLRSIDHLRAISVDI